jgi:hypothetical protein
MGASIEYTNLLGKLIGLKMQNGFNRKAAPNEFLYHLEGLFTDREILILKENNAIPQDYKKENYRR